VAARVEKAPMLDPARAAKAETYALSTGFLDSHWVAYRNPTRRAATSRAICIGAVNGPLGGDSLETRVDPAPAPMREPVPVRFGMASGENLTPSSSEKVVVRARRRRGRRIRTYAA
jgi:hypothetical protein